MRSIKKHTLLILLSLLLLSFQTPKKLIGKWQIIKIELPNGETDSSARKWIAFLNGGILKGGTIGKETNKTGNWTYNKDKQTLTFSSEEKNKDDGIYKIEKLTKDNLIIVKDGIKIFLIRLKTDTAVQKQKTTIYKKGKLIIYKAAAVYKGREIYNAEKQLAQLIETEDSDDCKVDYEFYYNPLSLVGNYYSYEFGEGGILACGPPNSTLGIATIDLVTGDTVTLPQLFTKASILNALKNDTWVKRNAEERHIDLEIINTFTDILDVLNQFQVQFKANSFAISEYDSKTSLVAVRFVAKEYMGFNHNRHLQLGLWLKPTAAFKKQIKNQTHFLLGSFKNGVTN